MNPISNFSIFYQTPLDFAADKHNYEICNFILNRQSNNSYKMLDERISKIKMGTFNSNILNTPTLFGSIDDKQITIPFTITRIGNYSFYKYSKLKTIVIPPSVTFIGNNAFEECYSLTQIA